MDVARSRGLRERFPGLLVLVDGSGDASAVFSLFFEKKKEKKERAPFAKMSVLSFVNKCLPWYTGKYQQHVRQDLIANRLVSCHFLKSRPIGELVSCLSGASCLRGELVSCPIRSMSVSCELVSWLKTFFKMSCELVSCLKNIANPGCAIVSCQKSHSRIAIYSEKARAVVHLAIGVAFTRVYVLPTAVPINRNSK